MSDAEPAYLDEIDCRFPYSDWGRCVDLIDRGIAISPNAAFGALHEICRPGASADVPAELLMRLLDYWESRFRHPAADLVGEAASALIRRERLTAEDVIARMRILASYQGQYAALSILYFASSDPEERVERTDAEIRKRWSAPGCL
jgi:hypothetical protein